MKTFKNLSLVFLFFLFVAMKGDKTAYHVFDQEGKSGNYSDIIKDAVKADIIMFGELHDNSIGHWLELAITKDLYAEKQSSLILGAEMFERDNQLLLDEYISGQIVQKNFEAEAKLWPNYKNDYKPLVEFAKEKNLRFIGTNIPRRYASLVNKKGFESLDSLSNEAKKLVASLPVKYDPELKGYKSMLEGEGMEGNAHITQNLPKAQAIKDATMAGSILENWEPGKTFVHFNGSYHSDNFEGIVWYLKQGNPDLKIMTITCIEQDTITDLKEESLHLADYIICIPSDMTKTY
jgi:uncharacterized iron-regulated protein